MPVQDSQNEKQETQPEIQVIPYDLSKKTTYYACMSCNLIIGIDTGYTNDCSDCCGGPAISYSVCPPNYTPCWDDPAYPRDLVGSSCTKVDSACYRVDLPDDEIDSACSLGESGVNTYCRASNVCVGNYTSNCTTTSSSNSFSSCTFPKNGSCGGSCSGSSCSGGSSSSCCSSDDETNPPTTRSTYSRPYSIDSMPCNSKPITCPKCQKPVTRSSYTRFEGKLPVYAKLGQIELGLKAINDRLDAFDKRLMTVEFTPPSSGGPEFHRLLDEAKSAGDF